MTPAELEAIKARAAPLRRLPLPNDVRVLLAEVERWRAQIPAVLNIHGNDMANLRAEVARLRAALEAAKIDHECCCEWPHKGAPPMGARCSCGADEHNAAIDRALRGEA